MLSVESKHRCVTTVPSNSSVWQNSCWARVMREGSSVNGKGLLFSMSGWLRMSDHMRKLEKSYCRWKKIRAIEKERLGEHSEEMVDMVLCCQGKVFIVGKREKILRSIWESSEQRD